jgi:hypothetical protein
MSQPFDHSCNALFQDKDEADDIEEDYSDEDDNDDSDFMNSQVDSGSDSK